MSGHVAVVGAGVFGAFTALALRRRGLKVTLFDSYGPGNSRSSSGGETRVIRTIYGGKDLYTGLAREARDAWRECETRWRQRVYTENGVLWMVAGESPNAAYVTDSLPHLTERGIPFERLEQSELEVRYPVLRTSGISWAVLEPEAGFLLSRRACALAVAEFVEAGGAYRLAEVAPGPLIAGRMDGLKLSDGSTFSCGAMVFACGPWLPALFPKRLGPHFAVTRQEVVFFGPPAGDGRFSESAFPVWLDVGERMIYGIPGNESRGFKVADDTREAPFDPTYGDRIVSPETIASLREAVSKRFPVLSGAPVVETRVCQYENTVDKDLLLDRVPGTSNAWILGGGSGHGFKFGPVLGERAAETVLGRRDVEPAFSFSRFPLPAD